MMINEERLENFDSNYLGIPQFLKIYVGRIYRCGSISSTYLFTHFLKVNFPISPHHRVLKISLSNLCLF